MVGWVSSRNISGERIRRLLSIARGEIGYKEQPLTSNFTKYGVWYGMNGQPWCAMFVSWVAFRAGCKDIIPQTASVSEGMKWFKNRGQWGNVPVTGAIVYFWERGKPGPTHVGIVETVDNNASINTIEGNAKDEVTRRTWKVNDKYINGYGYPRY